MIKVSKLGASSSSLSAHVHKSERVKAPIVMSSRSHSRSAVEAEGPSGGAVEQPLAVTSIFVWNPPTKRVRSPSRKAEGARRKDPESKIGRDEDSLLHNAKLAAGTVSSILRILISRGQLRCPLMRLWPYLSRGHLRKFPYLVIFNSILNWVFGWLAFQKKAVNTYSDLDFIFDLPSDKEDEGSFSTDYPGEPGTPAEDHSPFSPSASPSDA